MKPPTEPGANMTTETTDTETIEAIIRAGLAEHTAEILAEVARQEHDSNELGLGWLTQSADMAVGSAAKSLGMNRS